MGYSRMRYLVKILRKSIKRNPTAGQRRYPQQVSPPSMSITFPWHDPENPPKDLGEGARLSSYTLSVSKDTPDRKGVMFNCTYVLLVRPPDDFMRDMAALHREKFNYTETNNIQMVESLVAEPPYLYEYRPTRVQCYSCKAKFPHTELESDVEDCGCSQYDDCCGCYKDTDTKCPKCGNWNCCELEYEDIGETMRGKK